MILQTKPLKIKSSLSVNFPVTKICVGICSAEDETRMGAIKLQLSPSMYLLLRQKLNLQPSALFDKNLSSAAGKFAHSVVSVVTKKGIAPYF